MMPLQKIFITSAKKYSKDTAIVDRNLRKNISYKRPLNRPLLISRSINRNPNANLGIINPNTIGSRLSTIGALFAFTVTVKIKNSTRAAEN